MPNIVAYDFLGFVVKKASEFVVGGKNNDSTDGRT